MIVRMLVLVLLLSTGTLAMAQEGTTAAARLRAAIKDARASGVLKTISRESFLCSPRAGYSYRVQVSESGIRLTEEIRTFRRHASFPVTHVDLSPEGDVKAITVGVWVPARNGVEVRARVEGKTLRWDVASTRTAGMGEIVSLDSTPWTDDMLPILVTDLLWPLLSPKGELKCTRVEFEIRESYREDATASLKKTPAVIATALTEAKGKRVEVRSGKETTSIEVGPKLQVRRVSFLDAKKHPPRAGVTAEEFKATLRERR